MSVLKKEERKERVERTKCSWFCEDFFFVLSFFFFFAKYRRERLMNYSQREDTVNII